MELIRDFNDFSNKNIYTRTELFDVRFLVVLIQDIFESELAEHQGILVANELDMEKLRFIERKCKREKQTFILSLLIIP